MQKIIAITLSLLSIYSLQKRSLIPWLVIINYLISVVSTKFYICAPLISKGGVTLFFTDILVLVMLILIIAAIVRNPKVPKIFLLLLLYGVLLVFSAISGLRTNGLNQDYIGDLRVFLLYYIIPIAYFWLYANEIDVHKVLNGIHKSFTFVLVFCCYCWIIEILSGGVYLRCLNSDQTIIMCLYTLYCINDEWKSGKTKGLSCRSIILIVGMLLMQHNSVYMAFATGFLYLVLMNYRRGIIDIKFIGFLSVCAIAVVFIINIFEETVIMKEIFQTFEKFQDITAETDVGTIGTRFQVWRGCIALLQGEEWLVGQPFGSGFQAIMNDGIIWNTSPHSGYIEAIMRTGILGCICHYGLIVYSIFKLTIKQYYAQAALLLATMVYWYSYGLSITLASVIGIMIFCAFPRSGGNKCIRQF